ncbi:MAG: hypothetical protein IT437_14185 [Phycisphaerales bacterium]|nr:hypothetical protein [Phycisphaerales bacterium]
MERLLAAGLVLAASLTACAQVMPPGGAAKPERPREQGMGDVVPALNISDAGDLLTELEKADAGMRRLDADVLYDKTFALAGDRQVRLGTLWFQSTPTDDPQRPRRRFAIEFTKLYLDTRLQEDPITYIFDGQWFVEKDPKEKQIIRRQVVPPGEHFDPLRIGEGPLPIPIGQKREDIERAFQTTLLPPEDGLAPGPDASGDEKQEAQALITEVAGTRQLRLIPREGTEQARDFREIRIWYRRDTGGRLLPMMARTVSRDGNVALVKLANVKINAEGPPPARAFDQEPPGEGWTIRTEAWRGTGQ